ncbi:PAS domain-containing protein [Donghicola sp. C2-DW-16]|uniref:PAS domain-containing protein n=1 Tax=Donghicola mangrovi TaxID=2729614 RepID=A0ABX2PG29_9RHOB|nr:PAS domain-containing protein [Donghicola mangrovi]NVO27876.1 PAS domain-containing protein [Donghicola mangrovi]
MGVVLSLADFIKGVPPSALREVGDHWQSLRRCGGLPKRTDLDPKAMAPHLDKVFLVERIGTGHVRFRLCGSMLCDVLGMDLRGMPLSALFEPAYREQLGTLIEECFQRPAILHLNLSAGWEASGSYRMSLWPMLSDLGDASRALGCLVAENGSGPTKRFRLDYASTDALYAANRPDMEKPAPKGTGFEVIDGGMD